MNFDLNAEFWNQRYLTNDFAWDIGYVSTPIKAYIDQLDNKELTILIPGAGNSYEAEYLINKGFKNVFVCDMAEQPLLNLKKRCPAIQNFQLLHQDFFKLNSQEQTTHPTRFDLILEQTFFCAINPHLRQAYAEKMHSLLVPSGKLVGVLFNDELNKNEPPFGGNIKEYISYFEPLFKINKLELCYNSIQPRSGRELFINLEKV